MNESGGWTKTCWKSSGQLKNRLENISYHIIWCICRRITIDSTRLSVAVMAFARVGRRGRSHGKTHAGPLSALLLRRRALNPQLRGLIERYTDFKKVPAAQCG